MKMEYTEDNLLNLELRKINEKRKGKQFIKKIYKHKWVSMVIISLILLSSINVMMIYNFFKILQNI